MRTSLFVFLLGVAGPVMAQELPDAGLPDGGIEEGGAMGNTEENDPGGGPCLVAKDCPQSFACVDARCVPVKTRTAGCESVPAAALVAGAAFLLSRRRRA